MRIKVESDRRINIHEKRNICPFYAKHTVKYGTPLKGSRTAHKKKLTRQRGGTESGCPLLKSRRDFF